jgi:hypothetical protein
MFNKTPFRNVLADPRGKRAKLAIFSLATIVVVSVSFLVYKNILPSLDKTKVIRAVSSRLKVKSRKAVILVTGVSYDEKVRKILTAIRVTEYAANGRALKAEIFHFDGNIIQVQSLVMNFSDVDIENADYLKDKKALLFWKAFLPQGNTTEQIELTKINTVPRAYKIKGSENPKEEEIWKTLWGYALDGKSSSNVVMKNARINAPGKIFIPGTMYTLTISQDGSLSVETSSLVEK